MIEGICITIVFLSGGNIISNAHDQIRSKNHFSHYLNPESVVILKITSQPEEKAKTIKLQAKVMGVKNKDTYHPVTGEILAYITKDSSSGKLKYCDVIAVKNNFNNIEGPLNPGQFDYKRNLANRAIYQQTFLKQNQWRFIYHAEENHLMKFMFDVKDRFVKSIKENISDKSQQAVLLALLIGYTSELNDDIRQSFTETGIMHLLAVSGLHVGIIFLVLNFMFKGLLKLRHGNIFFIVVISVILWLYAGITGFSPSVLRATIMFNFLLIGKNIRKVNLVYNSILVSAFLLLLYEPQLIFHVGFQLSYAAVLGIVFVQPYLNSLLTTNSWVIKQLWPLISVTLSAQFFTLPLILYYFSQFPVYFFLANLLIIPISTLVIYLGFLMVFFDVLGIHSLTWFFALIDSFTMEIMSRIIFYIRQLPFVMIDNIYLSPLMSIILFIGIVYMCFWFFYKKRSHLFIFLSSVIMFVLLVTIWNFQNLKKNKMVIYAVPGHSLISLQECKKGIYIGDSAIIYDTRQMRLYSYRNLITSGINFHNTARYRIGQKVVTPSLYADNKIICAGSRRMLYLDQSFRSKHNEEKIKVDYILLAHNPRIKFDELKSSFDFISLVFDGSNSLWKIKSWKSECRRFGISYIDINETGAFIFDI